MAGEGGSGVDWESLAEATSGAIGSLVSTTVLYPLDTCKTKFQAELQTHHGAHKYRYSSRSIPSSSLVWSVGRGLVGSLGVIAWLWSRAG